MTEKQPTAVFIIIGNEILSGRTQDTNLKYLALKLSALGIRLKEVRVIPDIEQVIIDTINELRANSDYVFTSGGIGPTHDDITTESVAKAFGVKAEINDEALRRLTKQYEKPGDLNESRKKMAIIPVGAALIDNPISSAPGFKIGNVHVMAGVPSIFQAMVDNILPNLKGGKPIISMTITASISEGKLAGPLGDIQKKFPQVDIGSYPHIRDGKLGTSLVTRGLDASAVKEADLAIRELVTGLGANFIVE